MENNILHQGVFELYTAKELLVGLAEDKNNRELLEADEAKLEKVIALRDKNISDEITSTTKARVKEVEETYIKQMEHIKTKIKKIQSKKEKLKNKKVSERIELETEDLRKEASDLRNSIKDIMKEHRLPKICNNNLFHSLYMPKGFADFLKIFIVLLITLFFIPLGVYMFILPEQKMIYLAIIYIIMIVLVAGIYMIFENKVKDKYINHLKEIRVIKYKLRNNKKEQKKVAKAIEKDKDESVYALQDFDTELSELRISLEQVEQQKEEAIKTFEQSTKHEIISEIKQRYQGELDELKNTLNGKKVERKTLEEKIKNTALHLANTYEVYMGKEWVQIEKIDALTTFMKEKSINTVSEALVEYKNQVQ